MITLKPPFWNEFQPTLVFLARFLVVYVVGNLIYGWFIYMYEPDVDPITHVVTNQGAWIVSQLGWESEAIDYAGKSTTSIRWNGRGIISVYEGCNSINVMIVFLSFLFAFGPLNRATFYFSMVSLSAIYVANLARIVLLFLIVIYYPDHSYFVHKYLFTAFIYLIVFALWVIWVFRYAR